jgi:hypothetical protein
LTAVLKKSFAVFLQQKLMRCSRCYYQKNVLKVIWDEHEYNYFIVKASILKFNVKFEIGHWNFEALSLENFESVNFGKYEQKNLRQTVYSS